MKAYQLEEGETFYIADHPLGHTLGFVIVEIREKDVLIKVDRLNRDVLAAIPKDTPVHRIFEVKEIK